jgi:hypothetical protein
MRAADADRDRVAEFLNVAYSEGRLSKDEYDDRLENAFSARTHADLDLPVAQKAQLTERMTKVLTNGTSGANAPWRPEERLTCRLVDGSYPS